VKRLNARSDAELLELTTSDPEAFMVFYRRHERLVLGYLGVRVRRPELTADLAAETFALVLENASRFDPDRSGEAGAIPWILAIARNVLNASLRRGQVAEAARLRLGIAPLALQDEALLRIEEVAGVDPRVASAFEDLPDELRQAVGARVIEERDYGDIAAELECSELVVRKRVSRGLSRLRTTFSESKSG
jgi:RNA polymerase sigma-70 factor (ECF subfamily)